MDSYDAERFPLVDHTCPRCDAVGPARFTGPCASCVAELRDSMRRAATVVDAEYVPKINVVPNAVALKDD
jgi:hypothetical protein